MSRGLHGETSCLGKGSVCSRGLLTSVSLIVDLITPTPRLGFRNKHESLETKKKKNCFTLQHWLLLWSMLESCLLLIVITLEVLLPKLQLLRSYTNRDMNSASFELSSDQPLHVIIALAEVLTQNSVQLLLVNYRNPLGGHSSRWLPHQTSTINIHHL